jgi:hypothetical protein
VTVRVIGDALMLGPAVGRRALGDGQPYLLKRYCGVPTEDGVVSTIARKFFVILSHGLFLALATFLAWPLLQKASRVAIGRGGLPILLLATALVLIVVALLLVAATAMGQMADRLHRWLERLLGRWLGAWLERNALRFQRTDQSLASFFKHARWGSCCPCSSTWPAGWSARSRRSVPEPARGQRAAQRHDGDRDDADPDPRARRAGPAGLGVQDLGYLLSLKALGVPP